MTALVGLLIVLSLVLGGGTHAGFQGDAVIQFVAAPILVALILSVGSADSKARFSLPLIFAAALAFVVAVPLMSLPIGFKVPEALKEVAGVAHAGAGDALSILRPAGLFPEPAWTSLLSLMPPLAIFLGVVRATYEDRRQLSLVVCGVGLVCLLLGLVQVAQGPESKLRFFEVTNTDSPVGFFANRNHYAALCYVLLLWVAVWLVASLTTMRREFDQGRTDTAVVLPVGGGIIALVLVVAVILLSRSRAGIGLALVALAFAVVVAMSMAGNRGGRGIVRWLVGAVAIALAIASQYAIDRVFERFEVTGVADEARIEFSARTYEGLLSFLPTGAGGGSFAQIYQALEWPGDIGHTYANRAHNDILEWGLEFGLPGMAVAAVLVLWFAFRAIRLWFRSDWPEAIDHALAKASIVAILLLLAHSAVDYPLRTGGMMAVFAVAAGMLLDPAMRSAARRGDSIDESIPATKRMPAPARSGALVPAQALDVRKPVQPRRSWGDEVHWPQQWQTSSPAEPGAPPSDAPGTGATDVPPGRGPHSR